MNKVPSMCRRAPAQATNRILTQINANSDIFVDYFSVRQGRNITIRIIRRLGLDMASMNWRRQIYASIGNFPNRQNSDELAPMAHVTAGTPV